MEGSNKMNKKLIKLLLENGWKEGNNCYYTEESDGTYYYNTNVGTLSFTKDYNNIEEFVAKVETYEEIKYYMSLDYEEETESQMTGKEFVEKYHCNPDKIKFDGYIYTESDLAGMDGADYEEVMEFGIVIEE